MLKLLRKKPQLFNLVLNLKFDFYLVYFTHKQNYLERHLHFLLNLKLRNQTSIRDLMGIC